MRPWPLLVVLVAAPGCFGSCKVPVSAEWTEPGLYDLLLEASETGALSFSEHAVPEVEAFPTSDLPSPLNRASLAAVHWLRHGARPDLDHPFAAAVLGYEYRPGKPIQPIQPPGEAIHLTQARVRVFLGALTGANETQLDEWWATMNATKTETWDEALDGEPYFSGWMYTFNAPETLAVRPLFDRLVGEQAPTSTFNHSNRIRMNWPEWNFLFEFPTRDVTAHTVGGTWTATVAANDHVLMAVPPEFGDDPEGLRAWLREVFADRSLPEPAFQDWKFQRVKC